MVLSCVIKWFPFFELNCPDYDPDETTFHMVSSGIILFDPMKKLFFHSQLNTCIHAENYFIFFMRRRITIKKEIIILLIWRRIVEKFDTFSFYFLLDLTRLFNLILIFLLRLLLLFLEEEKGEMMR